VRPGVDSSQSHMDYSSQEVDPTPAHDYAVYEEGFAGCDRMEEKRMFYQTQDEAKDEEVPEDVVANNVVPEGEPEPQTRRRRRHRVPLIRHTLLEGLSFLEVLRPRHCCPTT